jgi:hypothetical protein
VPSTGTRSQIVRFLRVPRWHDLIHLSDHELARYDVAAVNLACAVGLPGAEAIDFGGCLKCLDQWAEGIGSLTEKGLATFRNHPERYDHSEPLYRMVTLVTGLKKYCGVQYNPAKRDAKLSDPFDLDEQFVYGAIQGPGGTCATLPILYAAIGRRLDYPIRLVHAKRHMFCRWDDPTTSVSLNIEGTNEVGMNYHPDEYYRAWPEPITESEERAYGFLKSHTPRQELADFVSRRGLIWWQRGNCRRALAAYLLAQSLDRESQLGAARVQVLTSEWEQKLRRRFPPGFPKVEIIADPRRARWPWVPWASELQLRCLEAIEDVLNDPDHEQLWWAPLRAGRKPLRRVPEKITTDRTKEQVCSTQP